MAVSNRQRRGTVHVMPGNGDGTFGVARPYYAGSLSTGVAAADFDLDGDVDLLVSNEGWWTSPEDSLRPAAHGSAFLPNNGDGTFGPDEQVFTGPAHFVEAGDVNNDRAPDAIFGRVVFGFGDFVAPLSLVYGALGGGDGRFAPAEPLRVSGEITGMAVADVTGDRRLDVALSLSHSYMQSAEAAVLAGRGDGTFIEAGRYEVGVPIASDVAVADFNADGRPDLAVTGDDPRSLAPFDRGLVVAFHNDGSGRMGAPSRSSFVGKPAGIAAGLLNRDRLPDLAVAFPTSDELGVLINNTRTITTAAVPVTATAGVPFVDRPVARFTVTGFGPDAPANPVADDPVLRSHIYWGDGTRRTEGRIVRNEDGSFSVLGSHTYRRPGVYRIVVLVEWPEAGVRKLIVSRALVRTGSTRTTP